MKSFSIFVLAAIFAGTPVRAAAQRVPPRADTSRAGARPLPGIVAQAEREACPRRDGPGARELWTRMRARYDDLDSTSTWAEMFASSGYVASGSLMRFDTVPSNRPDGTTDGWNIHDARSDAQHRVLALYDAPRVGNGRRGMAGTLRGSLSRGIAFGGYATLNVGISADISQVSAAWTYPPLDGELATHFISDLFGGRTNFRIERTEGPIVLAFCTAPGFRAQPYISGSLILRADSSLERVQWHYHTPEPREDAGGEVRFAAPGIGRALAPVEGELYRRHVGDQFFHRKLVYSAWSIDPAPFLPDSLLPPPPPPSRPPIVRHLPPTRGRP